MSTNFSTSSEAYREIKSLAVLIFVALSQQNICSYRSHSCAGAALMILLPPFSDARPQIARSTSLQLQGEHSKGTGHAVP